MMDNQKTDVLFCYGKSGVWIIGESVDGRRWVRANFDQDPSFVRKEDVDSYFESARIYRLIVSKYNYR